MCKLWERPFLWFRAKGVHKVHWIPQSLKITVLWIVFLNADLVQGLQWEDEEQPASGWVDIQLDSQRRTHELFYFLTIWGHLLTLWVISAILHAKDGKRCRFSNRTRSSEKHPSLVFTSRTVHSDEWGVLYDCKRNWWESADIPGYR